LQESPVVYVFNINFMSALTVELINDLCYLFGMIVVVNEYARIECDKRYTAECFV